MAIEAKNNSRILNCWNAVYASLENFEKLNAESGAAAEFFLNLIEQRESAIKANLGGTALESLPNFRSNLTAKIDAEICDASEKIDEKFLEFEKNFEKSEKIFENFGKFSNENEISATERKIFEFIDEILSHYRQQWDSANRFWTEFKLKKKSEDLRKIFQIFKPNENWNSRTKLIIAHVEMFKIYFNSL